MVEFALVIPILILLLCGVIDFGWIFGNQLMANNASREAARYAAIHYYEYSTVTEAEAAAAGIVTARAPMLKNPVTVVVVSGETLKVTVQYQAAVLTPVLSTFTGTYFNGTASSTMRIE